MWVYIDSSALEVEAGCDGSTSYGFSMNTIVRYTRYDKRGMYEKVHLDLVKEANKNGTSEEARSMKLWEKLITHIRHTTGSTR